MPFQRHNVEEWSRLDRLTGMLEHARVETGHWAANTSNSSHKYGKLLENKWEYKSTQGPWTVRRYHSHDSDRQSTDLDGHNRIQQLFVDFEKGYDSIKREVLYNILTEFSIPSIKLVRLIKMCLSEMYSRVRIGQFLSDAFPIRAKAWRCTITFTF
ncbi:hypothetical protein ANN_07735 [Periplaneta americana]|uniref:Reverse transcriptase domain-containing protein n=1 Tax=Periplaneta americana TaxID=6978 RepID=A0ABQ8T107_PERAM|nr:hypothetical protein ANN_07735 [Periplaneta americana]